jgi:hypothetical protein
MVTFVKLNEEDDSISVVVEDRMFMVIKRNDTGISIDYYNYVDDEPFKSDQIWFDDLKSNE